MPKNGLKVVQATQVRKDFQDVIDEVHYTGSTLVISKYGKPWVIVSPLPEGDKDLQLAIKKGQKNQVKKKIDK